MEARQPFAAVSSTRSDFFGGSSLVSAALSFLQPAFLLHFHTWQACQAVFRSMSMIEKSVDKCTITLDPVNAAATFKLHCKHGRATFLLLRAESSKTWT